MDEHHAACEVYLQENTGTCICNYLDMHSEDDVQTDMSKLVEELEELSLQMQVDGAHLNNPQSAEILYRKADGVDEALKIVRRHLNV